MPSPIRHSGPLTVSTQDAKPPGPVQANNTMVFLGLDSPLKAGIFVAYISIFASLDILIKLSQRGDQSGAYAYDITLLVFCTELLKMVLNLVMFLRTPE